jgi:shikimate kinase/3-dehydroquinate synthase
MTPGKTKAIAFVGFMGAGKTAAARATAKALGEPAIDVDDSIEAKLGCSIATVFERDGEAEFRRIEEELTLELLAEGGVLSLGGGAIESERVRSALDQHVVAWCRVSEEEAWRRSRGTGRPLAAERPDFQERFLRRRPLYEQACVANLPEGSGVVGREAAPWLAALRGVDGVRLAWALSDPRSYPAAVGAGALSLLDEQSVREAMPARLFAIADRDALAHHRGVLPATEATLELESSGTSKTLTEAERLLRELASAGARRDDGILAFGGGVVGDLAGFCASSYQRGVPVIQLPTTLVAQVDAAYGGKTGVDLPEAKNYVGAYHPPTAVLADPRLLATLPTEELAAGFAEVLKTALIAGGPLWERVRSLETLDPAGLDEIIFACAVTKLDVVAGDERDLGRRAVLNLGHSVGHALEAATGYTQLRHGEAVGLGMLAALRLSGAAELREEVAEILSRHGLPARLDADVSVDAVLSALDRDKKRTAEGVAFVLLERPGEPREGQQVEPAEVRASIAELMA